MWITATEVFRGFWCGNAHQINRFFSHFFALNQSFSTQQPAAALAQVKSAPKYLHQ